MRASGQAVSRHTHDIPLELPPSSFGTGGSYSRCHVGILCSHLPVHGPVHATGRCLLSAKGSARNYRVGRPLSIAILVVRLPRPSHAIHLHSAVIWIYVVFDSYSSYWLEYGIEEAHGVHDLDF